MAMTGIVFPLQEFVFELDNPCQCEGCRRKISKVIYRLEGIHEYRFENNRLVLTGRNIDPSNVIRRLSEAKKHIRFIGMTFPNQQLPPRPEQPLPCMADQHCAHHPVHACCINEPQLPPPACHCQSDGHYHGPHFNEPPPPPPPPSSAFHCPPPQHHECNHGHGLRHQIVNNAPPAAELENFLHGQTSPLIPRNACPVELLRQLGNMKNLKQVDFIKKQGIKVTFDDGRVTSWYPTYSMELRPGFDRDYQHLQPRYVSPFSDEDPNAYCSIM